MSAIISRTTSLGRRLATALLSLALLLQGQAVLAMTCHSDQDMPLAVAQTSSAADEHHENHAHDGHDLSVDSSSETQLDQQDCAHCAGGCAMNYVTCNDAGDGYPCFKSPSPSISTGDLGPGNVPDGPLRPPR